MKGTAAWSPHDEKWPAFNCFHTHCSGRKTLDFLEQIEKDHPGIVDKHCAEKWTYEKGSADRHGRVKVNLPQAGEQEKGEFVADVAKALADKEFWFTSNKRVTRIDKTIEIWTNAEGVEVEGRERLTIFPVSPPEAESTLGTHICTGTTNWKEEEGRKIKQFVRHSMDNTTAKMLLAAPGLIDSLPRIDRVLDVTVPIAGGGGVWATPKRGYNPDLRLLLDADFKLREMPLDEALAMLNDIVRDFPFADDGFTEALTHLENAAEDSPLYLDIETTGLDPRKSTIRLLTLSSGDGQTFIIDLDKVYFPDRLRAILESRTIVGQNLLFDSAFLKHHFKVNITKTWDTMIAGRLLSAGVMEETEGKDKDGNPSTILRPLGNDLSSLLKRYCGIELGEDLSKSDWSQPELTDAQLKYAAEDVTFLPQLKKALEEAIEKEGMTGALELDNDCHPAMRDLNLTGMHVDRAKLEGMYHIAKRTLEDARVEVIQLLGNGDSKWNPDSNSDLREGLARKGISVTATNKEALSPFDRSKEVLALRRYRRAKSADVEKMKSLLDAIDDDSRVRTTYNPVGAITGRMSASDPNIQQTPQTDKSNIRYAFTAPPGKKLIKCDWNAMELRAAASYVNEESLLALFAAGRDAHRHTAASIYNKQEDEVTKPERSIAKTANFNLVYGGSASNLMAIINEDGEVITLEEAEHIRRTFFRLYPVFRDWHSQTWDEAKGGHIKEERTALGHRRKFHPSLETWKVVFAALNFPIQSACAEVLKFVVQDLHKQLPAGAQIVALLHDEIVLEADEADAPAVMELTLKTMEEIGSVVFTRVHTWRSSGDCPQQAVKIRPANQKWR